MAVPQPDSDSNPRDDAADSAFSLGWKTDSDSMSHPSKVRFSLQSFSLRSNIQTLYEGFDRLAETRLAQNTLNQLNIAKHTLT